MLQLPVVRQAAASLPGEAGYGRNGDEARAHFGWKAFPVDTGLGEVETLDGPGDATGSEAADSVCCIHIPGDDEIPPAPREALSGRTRVEWAVR